MRIAGREFSKIAAGIIFANLAGAAAYACTAAVIYGLMGLPSQFSSLAGALSMAIGFPSVVIVPVGMGFIGAYFWRGLNLRIWQTLVLSFAMSAVGVLGAYFMFNEGHVCLVIAAPLLFLLIFMGALLGRLSFTRSNASRLQLCLLPLAFVAMVSDANIRGSRAGVVVDELTVRASPAEVWKHVVAFPKITEPPSYWLNRIGLPSPAETTCAGEFIGAERECIFSNGLVFKERVAELEPGRLLTFDIVEQPRDPELLGHLDLQRGQFELRQNADGTTTLIGRSWYTLHVRPHWYFDWWTRDITREVHLRVMRHIKALAETPE